MYSSNSLYCFACILASVYCGAVFENYPPSPKITTNKLTLSPFFGESFKGNFFFAYEYCKGIDMRLVTPNTPEKYATLVEFMKRNKIRSAWTSGNDLAKEGSYMWMVTSNLFEFAQWHIGQPDNYLNNEHCIEIRNKTNIFMLNDLYCGFSLAIICEPIESM